MKPDFGTAAIIDRAEVFDFPFRFAFGKLHFVKVFILGDFNFEKI